MKPPPPIMPVGLLRDQKPYLLFIKVAASTNVINSAKLSLQYFQGYLLFIYTILERGHPLPWTLPSLWE